MLKKSSQEVPDIAYAMNSPCSTGHEAEFRGAASKTMHDLTGHNEILFNLRSSDVGFSGGEPVYAEFHGWSHVLCPLSALIDPQTESMKRFVYAPQYQGDMDGEFLVRAVHRCLTGIREKKSPFGYKVDITRELIRGFIEEKFIKESRDFAWFGRRERGHKAAFYLARGYCCSAFEVRKKFGFEDASIESQANNSAWNEAWMDGIKHGDHFFVERKPRSRRNIITRERQTYRDVIDVKDEGFAIMIDRISGVIADFQDLIWGAESEESVTKKVTGADVLDAFMRTNEIPQNTYFEQQFGL